MRIDILTLFPEMFDGPLGMGIVQRARQAGVVEIVATNLRDFATDAYRKVDDAPFGGGPGMVMMCQPLYDAVEHLQGEGGRPGRVILMSPQGRPFTQRVARELAALDRILLVAGRYEGFDERVREGLADDEISLGDFVLSGGEIPAMAVTDAVVRLLPGALGSEASLDEESFAGGLLEYPQYTRPRSFRGMDVPDVLLSGNHAAIQAWRAEQARLRTQQRRPDLWADYNDTTRRE
ncbi:MAG: tRNA (guanosine(37)-N1)-methyltransferase TrmD [Planctomycetes bacterium]|nr:tRNA (guanosine(37)-N1)-methyltransferase TrmD [Planctomycetota bacterium]